MFQRKPSFQCGMSICAIFLAICGVIALSQSVVLYFQTNSFFKHDYEWYSASATALRKFPHLSPHLPQCDASALLLPHHHPTILDTRLNHIDVYVCYGKSRFIPLFPYFWNTILIADPSRNNHVDQQTSSNEMKRFVFHHNITFHIFPVEWLSNEAALKRFQSNNPLQLQNLLIVSEFTDQAQTLINEFNTVFPTEIKQVGLIAFGNEDCRSESFRSFSELGQHVKFAFSTYGVCSFQEGVGYWPLGPKTEDGFPSFFNPFSTPDVLRRKYWINLMVSYTAEKPTRFQALLVLEKYCQESTQPCYLSSSSVVVPSTKNWFIEHFFVQKSAESSFEEEEEKEINQDYVDLLSESVFTACPLGKNPESYRIWEAMLAGSIPIVEKPSLDVWNPAHDLHPSYGDRFDCVEIHPILKHYHAPVLYVSEWKEVVEILEFYRLHPLELLHLQQRNRQWIHRFLPNALLTQLAQQIRKFV
jgi:hypothetical protein